MRVRVYGGWIIGACEGQNSTSHTNPHLHNHYSMFSGIRQIGGECGGVETHEVHNETPEVGGCSGIDGTFVERLLVMFWNGLQCSQICGGDAVDTF